MVEYFLHGHLPFLAASHGADFSYEKLRTSQVRQFERYIEVTSIVKSSVFNGLYDLEMLVYEIFVITYMDHKAIENR